MKVPLESRGFTHQRRGDLTLITPTREKVSRSQWADDELPFRSVVVDAAGRIVSAGFPKFFNYAEDDADSQALRFALGSGAPVEFTEKVDGSLCIRSVVNGRVMFRTRGTLDETDHVRAMRAVAQRRYPRLLDPHYNPGDSMLFEFVSPRFRIVLPYEDDDLILLGAVMHDPVKLWDTHTLRMTAHYAGLRMVDTVTLPNDPAALLDTVAGMPGEGVVARTGQTLVKLKSADYLARHRLKYALTTRAIREACEQRNIRSEDEFAAYLAEHGADWELVADVRPIVRAYIDAVEEADARTHKLGVQVNARRGLDRKSFAQGFAVPLGAPFTAAAFALLDDKGGHAQRMIRGHYVDAALAGMEARDEEMAA